MKPSALSITGITVAGVGVVALGKTIAPTAKSFRRTMATIGHWKGATMDHEWLFWDNHELMRQIGLVQ